jgi:hypothetical protein
MKNKRMIGFNFRSDSAGKRWLLTCELFREIGREDLIAKGREQFGWFLGFNDDDPALPVVRSRLDELAKEEGFSWHEQIRTEFSGDDLRAAQFLWLSMGTRERGVGGPAHGTKYDLSNACPLCGTGAIQTSSLILTPNQFPKRARMFQTMYHEYLVSSELMEVLARPKFNGLEMRQAVAKGIGSVPWYQLIASFVMPPMSKRTKGVIRDPLTPPCTRCNRDGHFNTYEELSMMTYDAADVSVKDVPDAVVTWEHFGVGGLQTPFQESNFSSPLLLVSRRVFEVLQGQKVRGLSVEPVRID